MDNEVYNVGFGRLDDGGRYGSHLESQQGFECGGSENLIQACDSVRT